MRFQNFLNSGFFDWLWRASWQGSIVILLVLGAQWLLGKHLTPRGRHALWFLVTIRLILPGSFETHVSLFNVFNPHPTSISTSAGLSENRTPATGTQTVMTETSTLSTAFTRSCSLLCKIWLAGAVVLCGYLLVSAWQLGRRVRGQRPVTNESLLNLLEDCKQEMGVLAPLTLVETASVSSPSLLGFVRPRLLLPEGLTRSFSLSELRFVFLHELGHLQRGDIIVNWLMVVPLVIHWFNPLVWFAFNRMRADGESACDALALTHAREGEQQPYGQTVIKLLERFSCAASAPGLVGILENTNHMKSRIEMIAQFKRSNRWPIVAAALFAFLALVTLTNAIDKGSGKMPDVSFKIKHETPLSAKILVNLAREQGHRYLLASIVLEGDSPDLAQAVKTNDAELRDAAASLLSAKSISDLDKPDARNTIRTELLSPFNSILGDGVVRKIYLTEFAIQ